MKTICYIVSALSLTIGAAAPGLAGAQATPCAEQALISALRILYPKPAPLLLDKFAFYSPSPYLPSDRFGIVEYRRGAPAQQFLYLRTSESGCQILTGDWKGVGALPRVERLRYFLAAWNSYYEIESPIVMSEVRAYVALILQSFDFQSKTTIIESPSDLAVLGIHEDQPRQIRSLISSFQVTEVLPGYFKGVVTVTNATGYISRFAFLITRGGSVELTIVGEGLAKGGWLEVLY